MRTLWQLIISIINSICLFFRYPLIKLSISKFYFILIRYIIFYGPFFVNQFNLCITYMFNTFYFIESDKI